MVDANSLTYLLYSLLTLAAHDPPTTDPSLKPRVIDSEPPVTIPWNQDPHDHTETYNALSCPPGEVFTECEAGCEYTCKNKEGPLICPRMCLPGCKCEPGVVRGPDGKCIKPSDCPPTGAPPVTEDADILKWTLPAHADRKHKPRRRIHPRFEQDPDEAWDRTNQEPPVTEDAYRWTLPEDRRGPTVQSLAERNPEYVSRRRIPRIDPDEVEPYTDFPRVDPDEVEPYTDFPRVDPDEIDRAEQDPRFPDKLNAGGCPWPEDCNSDCKRKGFKYGICQGPGYWSCTCLKH